MKGSKKIAVGCTAALAAGVISLVGFAPAALAAEAATAPASSETVTASPDTAVSPQDTKVVAASPDPAAIPSAAATQAATPVATQEAAAPAASQAAAPTVKADPTPAATDTAVSTSTNTKAPAPTPSAPAKDTKPVTSGSPSKGTNGGGYTNPYDKVCKAGDSSALSLIRNADLSTATVTLKSPYTSCDVTLQSFETDGPTWETSGTQKFVDYAGITLTKKAPTATLTVTTKGCFTQQDLASGSLVKNDGIEAPLPHHPDSNVPNGLLSSYNGGSPCAPPVAAAGGTANGTQSVCTPDHTATPNQLTITSAPGSSAVVKQGTGEGIFKAADDGTFDVSDLVPADAYPVTFQVEFVGKGGDYTKPIDITFDQPKSSTDCFTAASSTVDAICTVAGAEAHAHDVAGTNDTTFVLNINGEDVDSTTVKAGESFDDYYTVPEDSTGGRATVLVKVDGKVISDVKEFTTDCLPNITIIATPAAPTSTATCTADGTLPKALQTDAYSSAYDRKYNGPGDYQLTLTAKQVNTEFATGKTVTLVVHVPAKVKDAKACPTSTPTPSNTATPNPVPNVNAAGTPPTTGQLAFTGSNPSMPLVAAGLLLAAGVALTVARRRRSSESTPIEEIS